MSQERKKIEEIQQSGFFPFVLLKNKLIKISSFEIGKDKVSFILESKLGETYDFNCTIQELDKFLANFIIPKANKKLSTISDIRSVLFDTLTKLQSDDIEIDRADSIAKIYQTLLNTAKIEIQYKSHFGGKADVKMLEE